MIDSIRGTVIANGLALPNVLVKVYVGGTGTLANIYADPLFATPIVNDGVTSPLTDADGSYGPFYVADGKYDLKMVKVGYAFVDADTAGILVHGEQNTSFVLSDQYATLALADAAAVLAGKLLWINKDYAITSNTAIAADVYIPKGPKFIISGATVLTFQKSLHTLGAYQIFVDVTPSGTGVAFSAVGVSVTPQWWGAVGDGATNDIGAINQALSALSAGASRLISPKVTYRVEASVDYSKIGNVFDPKLIDWGGSVFEWHGGANGAFKVYNNHMLEIINFKIDGNSIASAVGIKFDANAAGGEFTTLLKLSNFDITKCVNGMYLGDGTSSQVSNSLFEDFRITDCTNGVVLDSSNVDLNTFERGTVSACTNDFKLIKFGTNNFVSVNGYGALTNPGTAVMFLLESWTGHIRIVDSQSEGNVGDTLYFLKMTGYGGSSATGPIDIIDCSVDQEILFDGTGGSVPQKVNIIGGYTRAVTVKVADLQINYIGAEGKAGSTIDFQYFGVLNNLHSNIASTVTLAGSAQHLNYNNFNAGASIVSATEGSMKFPNGIIHQWGGAAAHTIGAAAAYDFTVTFPATFPNTVGRAMVTVVNANQAICDIMVKSATTSGMVITVINNGGVPDDFAVNYYVVGN